MSNSNQEIGALARWSVSSHKYGFSVANLRDNNDDTFWQSEGPQPHIIDLAFPKRVLISSVHLCCSHTQDDSYTPSKVYIAAGTSVHDLTDVRVIDMTKPDGWLPYPLRPILIPDPDQSPPPTLDSGEPPRETMMIEKEGPSIPAFFVRITIVENHLNGKDTHLRGVKIFGMPASSLLTQYVPTIPDPSPPPVSAPPSSTSPSFLSSLNPTHLPHPLPRPIPDTQTHRGGSTGRGTRELTGDGIRLLNAGNTEGSNEYTSLAFGRMNGLR